MSPKHLQTALLGLGSNVGDREANLRKACRAIRDLPGCSDLQQSPVYQTAPMGPQDQGDYLNMAASIRTSHTPRELLAQAQRIEAELGRRPVERRRRWGPRVIDIDLLLYGDAIIDEPGLTVPHPGLAQRWFVLKPLADLAPQATHPLLGKTVAQLLDAVKAGV
ncbi:MAG: 2-amino-4-hydroxy-6-hydroxymethyldihydropteridine diphosphokinase [Planctomycetota bacterium]